MRLRARYQDEESSPPRSGRPGWRGAAPLILLISFRAPRGSGVGADVPRRWRLAAAAAAVVLAAVAFAAPDDPHRPREHRPSGAVSHVSIQAQNVSVEYRSRKGRNRVFLPQNQGPSPNLQDNDPDPDPRGFRTFANSPIRRVNRPDS